MKLKLAQYFKNKDIYGAKTYFMESLKKRPDVLMQASDTTGELKLAMQVITTCDNEYKHSLKSVLDDRNDFKELMTYFKNLNSIVSRYLIHTNTENDIRYLHVHRISYIAIEIATMILCTDSELSAITLARIVSDMEKE